MKKRILFSIFSTIFFILLISRLQGESNIMQANTINLPDTIDGWELEGPPRHIDETNIFDYMNGAGELYLSYNFDHLNVYEYTDANDNEIMVEIYHMKHSRDAFGLLSLDWDGEAVRLTGQQEKDEGHPLVPFSRALYGEGLLRIWADNLYVRILALKESPGVREVILQLGEIISAGRTPGLYPEMLKAVLPSQDSSWTVKRERTAYFYSHLILNSLFYLSHENILNLDHSTEALLVTFEKRHSGEEKNSAKLLIIKYPDNKQAAEALEDFYKAYLPEGGGKIKLDTGRENQNFFKLEDGWLGYKLLNGYLALVFESPDIESAREIISRAKLK